MDENEDTWSNFWKYVNLITWFFAITLMAMVAYLYFNNTQRSVSPSMVLPTPIPEEGEHYEHCVIKEDTGAAFRAAAGTPIPTTVVAINTPLPTVAPVEQPTLASIVPTEIPETPEPAVVPTEVPFNPDIGEVIQVGAVEDKNYHVVIVGVGYSPDINQYFMINTIMGLNKNFVGVNVDFSYARNPIMVKLQGVEQAAGLSENDANVLVTKIRSMAKADAVLLLVNTNQGLGNSHIRGRGINYIVINGEETDPIWVASHEVAHELGLNDGYSHYLKDQIPGSELFYLDSMPTFLVRALKELGTVPPIYEDGTCGGRKIYRFYPKQGNIMATYQPTGPYPWGDNIFTPLQVVIMNDFVSDLRK